MLELVVTFVLGGVLGVLVTAVCAAGARKTECKPPPWSEADQRRLSREWTDANLRGDVAARHRVEDEILGRPAPQNKTDAPHR